jgi:hypothetical protein
MLLIVIIQLPVSYKDEALFLLLAMIRDTHVRPKHRNKNLAFSVIEYITTAINKKAAPGEA